MKCIFNSRKYIFCLVLMMLWIGLHYLGEEDYNLDKRDMF